MKLHAMPQRSPEWFAARLGLVTASNVSAVLAKIKTGEAAARRDYRTQLVLERLCGRSLESGYINDAMQRGIDCEPLARAAYEAATGSIVSECGFCQHDTLAAGCSLDGFVDDYAAVVEIKCPKPSTHLATLRDRVVPSDYVPQVNMAMWITGARRCDFVSFDDRFPWDLQLVIVPYVRDDAAVAALAASVETFLAEVDAEYAEISAWRT